MKTKKKVPVPLKKFQKKIKLLKFKVFVFLTLPMAIITIGQAAVKEYIKQKANP